MEQSPAEGFALRGESSALVVGEAQSALAELLAQHPVLLDEVGDDLCLLAVDEAGEGGEWSGIAPDDPVLALVA